MTSISSNFNDHEERSRRRKRIRIEIADQHQSIANNNENQNQIRWKSPAEQHTYSSNLLEALRNVRRRTSPLPSGSRDVRDAADKILAVAGKGRTRWSRAILANRVKLRLKNHKKAKVRSKLMATGSSLLTGQKLPPLEKRVKVLGRLVPGCRKLTFPNLLEETMDYVAALQMQIRAMAALADVLTGPTADSESSSSNPVRLS